MDNETPQQNNPQVPSNQEPASQPTTGQSGAGFGGGMRTIQPLNPNLKPEDTTPQVPAQTQPNPVQVPPQTANTTPATDMPQPTRPDTSSIYPDVTKGIGASNYPTPSPADSAKDESKAVTFNDGYSIGGTIFWYQLIAGIVFGIIMYGIDSSLLKGATTSVIGIVSLFYYLVEFFVVAYIPYNTLKNNGVEEPLWLTTFGVAVQSIILATLFELLISLIIRSVINHGVSSSLAHIGGAGLGALAIAVYIGFFIASYFLTKLSWGVAFSLFGKIKSKVVVKAIGIAVIAFIVGGIAYHYLNLHSSTNGVSISTSYSSCQSNGLCKYQVSGNPSFSLDYYKGAKVINGRTANATGLIDYATTTTGQGVHISVAKAASSGSCSPALTDSQFSIQVQGVNGTVCVFNNTASNLTSYTSYVQVNGQNYVITMISYGYQQNQDTVKSIFNSIVIT